MVFFYFTVHKLTSIFLHVVKGKHRFFTHVICILYGGCLRLCKISVEYSIFKKTNLSHWKMPKCPEYINKFWAANKIEGALDTYMCNRKGPVPKKGPLVFHTGEKFDTCRKSRAFITLTVVFPRNARANLIAYYCTVHSIRKSKWNNQKLMVDSVHL